MEGLDEWMLEPLELEQKAPSFGNEFNISVAFLSDLCRIFFIYVNGSRNESSPIESQFKIVLTTIDCTSYN